LPPAIAPQTEEPSRDSELGSSPPPREFEFSDAHFETVQRLLYARAGIDLSEDKRMLVYGRLARRLRTLGLRSFGEYLERLEDPDSRESVQFLNALTTNVTEFFREPHHFEFLTERVVPHAIEHGGPRRLRVWSAGCSTGEEPLSIAMALSGTDLLDGWDVKILATDIDTEVLETAARAVYPMERVAKLPRQVLRRFFQRGEGANSGSVRVKPEIVRKVTFRQLNLMEEWPLRGPLDVIFCRNVVIYFDQPTRSRLMDRFARLLSPAGFLFLGHSEALIGAECPRLSAQGRTVYAPRSDAREALRATVP
jgi:chemotaxis protein methyltransferase CheR